jgi:xanthosine utilization system XapX-like protein
MAAGNVIRPQRSYLFRGTIAGLAFGFVFCFVHGCLEFDPVVIMIALLSTLVGAFAGLVIDLLHRAFVHRPD